ncbi:MAG TPA: IS481 family transposase [Acetobacteraceae bacterium]|nr:IS481 family transposase [Acetobacteraceae bacterium]
MFGEILDGVVWPEGDAMAVWGYSMMELKAEFVTLASREGANLRELCRRFRISPTTGYEVLARYVAEGLAGLVPRSRRPLRSAGRTEAETEAAVLEVRGEHPAWGGRKIAALLRRRGLAAPAPSTVTAILRRHGVVLGGQGAGAPAVGRFEHERPNDLWQMDFKGHVALACGARCHPLTVLDDHSRFSLVTAACGDEREETVKGHLRAAFERYGLPWRLVCDNGPPWGSRDPSELTGLAVWMMEQDVVVTHSRPLHPQTLGKEERFHRSLKAEALQGPPFADLAQAQAAFDRFRRSYNTERPHDGIRCISQDLI